MLKRVLIVLFTNNNNNKNKHTIHKHKHKLYTKHQILIIVNFSILAFSRIWLPAMEAHMPNSKSQSQQPKPFMLKNRHQQL